MPNVDERTVAGFGQEWQRFDQRGVHAQELDNVFEMYFAVFPWGDLPKDAVGFDLGCGSGRWARRVAPRVGSLLCIDASADAMAVARQTLAEVDNCTFAVATVDEMPLADDSMDFGYSLGVLHHVPDTAKGLRDCVRKLKPGAPFLLYLYYAFDNRPWWYRRVWQTSDLIRRGVSRLPPAIKHRVTDLLAATVYWPAARSARILERAGVDVSHLPLSEYRDRSWYIMRNDSLDRFGTRLEQRFTRAEIEQLMREAGLDGIRFHDGAPYWCAVGRRAT